MPKSLTLEILRQPDDETCGPTCLHAVYRYLGREEDLDHLVSEVKRVRSGGTLAPYLGVHALERGYRATIYTYNLEIFDPTWFPSSRGELDTLLREQAQAKASGPLLQATEAYREFLQRGGLVRYEELGPELIRRFLARRLPIMTGLSATYLYGTARERLDAGRWIHDSIRGAPAGHFVVVHGYDRESDSVLVADPYHGNPLSEGPNYRVGLLRLMGAILLGVLTYDGNLLIVEPNGGSR